jgi:ACS family allantoate permease-like MFS transporter
MGSSLEGSDDKHQDEKHHAFLSVTTKEVDTAAELGSGEQGELDPQEAARVLRKIDKHILPLMCSKYFLSHALANN